MGKGPHDCNENNKSRLAKIATQASDSNKNGITTLEDGQEIGTPGKYYKIMKRKNIVKTTN